MKKLMQILVVPVVLAGLVVGCKSTDSADTGQLVSILITGHPEGKIMAVVIETFEAHGYLQARGLTFEKQGTKMDTGAYGGWSGNPVWFKVRAELTERGAQIYVLSGDAFVIVDRDIPAMKEERKLHWSKRKEVKQIFDEIKARLDAPAS